MLHPLVPQAAVRPWRPDHALRSAQSVLHHPGTNFITFCGEPFPLRSLRGESSSNPPELPDRSRTATPNWAVAPAAGNRLDRDLGARDHFDRSNDRIGPDIAGLRVAGRCCHARRCGSRRWRVVDSRPGRGPAGRCPEQRRSRSSAARSAGTRVGWIGPPEGRGAQRQHHPSGRTRQAHLHSRVFSVECPGLLSVIRPAVQHL